MLLGEGQKDDFSDLLQTLARRFSGTNPLAYRYGPVLVPAGEATDGSAIAGVYSGWIQSGEPTVIRLPDGQLHSRFLVFSVEAGAGFPQALKFFQDGSAERVYNCGSGSTPEREAFYELVESLSYAASQSVTALDSAGAESYIRSRFERDFPALAYHNPLHIQDVVDAAIRIAEAEGVSERDTLLLRMAALFHDAGFMYSVERHEERGADLAAGVLPVFGFSPASITQIRSMVLATRVPQRPETLLEKILCDADLDYLGRSDFYETGGRLYDELRTAGVVNNMNAWNRLQYDFLNKHRYHTPTSRKFREPEKQKRIGEIAGLISENE